MTRAQQLARSLRQLTTLLYVLGFFASIGFLLLFLEAVAGEASDALTATYVVVSFVGMWIGLAWMGSMANGMAEVLAPTAVPESAEQVA